MITEQELDAIKTELSGLQQALAKRRDDINVMKESIELAKAENKELRTTINTLYPITIMALLYFKEQMNCEFDEDFDRMVGIVRRICR